MAATAFPAAAIVSGTIATPRLGSGTADATSFLRGDSTWAVVPEVTRASLGLATTDSPTFAGGTFNTGTITTSQPLSLSQTWDNAATTFTGLQVNATDTASAAASLLMDLKVGGVSKASVNKAGMLALDSIKIGTTDPHLLKKDPIFNGLAIRNNADTDWGNISVKGVNLYTPNTNSRSAVLYDGGGGVWLWFLGGIGVGWGSNIETRITRTGVGTLAIGLNANDASGSLALNTLRVGGGTSEALITSDAANILAQRNSTTGQKSRLYKTYTSATSGEWLEFDAATDASNFDIAASIGSAGGTARGIRIGGKNAAGTFTSWMSFSTDGAATIPVGLTCPSIQRDASFNYFSLNASTFRLSSGIVQEWYPTISVLGTPDIRISRGSTGPTYDVRCIGGIRSRNFANDADAPITASNITASGALQIGNAAVAETPVATHTLIIKDSTGTSYRVLAVAV